MGKTITKNDKRYNNNHNTNNNTRPDYHNQVKKGKNKRRMEYQEHEGQLKYEKDTEFRDITEANNEFSNNNSISL